MKRGIASVLPAQLVIDDGDMRLWRALPLPSRQSLGPFVFIDHYRHRSKRGIGDRPHPHAGIEVLSYLLEGGMEHRDSMGFTDRLGPGDAQWIRAGRGILHAEQPFGGR
ncbi:MAG TPA: pirin family protein, partial [Acetobacteraceae bacterium]